MVLGEAISRAENSEGTLYFSLFLSVCYWIPSSSIYIRRTIRARCKNVTDRRQTVDGPRYREMSRNKRNCLLLQRKRRDSTQKSRCKDKSRCSWL